jgi:hypothetical protein
MLLEDKIQYYNLVTGNDGSFECMCSAGGLLALTLATQIIAFFQTFSIHYSVITLLLDSIHS